MLALCLRIIYNNITTEEMTMTKFRDTLIVSLLLLVFIHILAAMCFPTAYGVWLQQIDNGRYELLEEFGGSK